jgi:SAM-dependent methyltransferase
MADRSATDLLNLRLPLYAYTAPLWTGRRVLEIGCDEGDSARYLATQGAERVVVIDSDLGQIERARGRFSHPKVDYRPATDLRQMGVPDELFDLIIVPEGRSLVGNRNLLMVLRRILAATGHLMIGVVAAERRTPAPADGIGYYELVDALEGHFPAVRMLGRTPFLGFGLVEFDSAADALRVDATLLEGRVERPSHYVAIAGQSPPPTLGYALVQVPFDPVERLLQGGVPEATSARGGLPDEVVRRLEAADQDRALLSRQNAEVARLSAKISQLTVEVDPTATAAAPARAELAERRLDEAEGRAVELRRRLDDALTQAESAVRVSRVHGDEMNELRARLRRAAEDRLATDEELGRLRRALAEADEAVVSLTRRTAEEMTAVAQQIASGLRAAVEPDRRTRARAGTEAPAALALEPSSEPAGTAEERVREAEQVVARSRAEVVELTRGLQAAEERNRVLAERAALVAERDQRIDRLEGDKRALVRRMEELETARHGQAVAAGGAGGASVAVAIAPRSVPGGRDRVIAELLRAAAAHASEVNRLRASIDEQAALVIELEDSLRLAEARASAAEKEAAALRRGAKELEEADRTRRGRLAELEGKLLRLERERSTGAGPGAGGGASSSGRDGADDAWMRRLGSMEQRALAAEQRLLGLEEALAAAELRASAAVAEAARATARASAPTPTTPTTPTAPTPKSGEDLAGGAASDGPGSGGDDGLAPPPETHASPAAPAHQNGTHGLPDSAEIQGAIEEVEQQLRHELRMLAAIEDTLTRARDEVTRSLLSGTGDRTDLERAIATKDAQLVEGRLELTRLRRESEVRQTELEREIDHLRTRPDPVGSGAAHDTSQGTQLIVMHTTLANIRRRAARLRDELEGFRRRLDSLPPGALSSLLAEIGEDLGEFAK